MVRAVFWFILLVVSGLWIYYAGFDTFYYGDDFWYVDSGFKAEQCFIRNGETRITTWTPAGTVVEQITVIQDGSDQVKESPPWLWGVTDQAKPSIPERLKDDARWRAVLYGQQRLDPALLQEAGVFP